MNIIIATIKPWNIDRAHAFRDHSQHTVELLTEKEELTRERVQSLNPDYLFFPHWSWMIPEPIVEQFECVVFHMTDVPFGRGGSPLQNLIARGFETTRMSALRASPEVDSGDVYMKRDLCLHGNAEEIYIRASDLIFEEMIPYILEHRPVPEPQEGEGVVFDRRTPEDGEITPDFDLETIYDFIRMLDAKGYPDAYIQFGSFKLKFRNAILKHNRIDADVEIVHENDE